MDKREFDRLQAASKECWAELSLTGATEKPERMFKYLNSCPACQVAFDGVTSSDCTHCPADLWRAIAVEASKMDEFTPGYAVCDDSKQWFYIWRSTGDIEERKEMARRIARMNWTYIPELHDPIRNKYRVIIEVKSDEVHILEASSRKEAEKLALSATPGPVQTTSKTVVQIDKL